MPTSELTDTSLNIAGTTTIKGIESTLTNNASSAATSSAILTAINNSASNVSSYVDSQISNIKYVGLLAESANNLRNTPSKNGIYLIVDRAWDCPDTYGILTNTATPFYTYQLFTRYNGGQWMRTSNETQWYDWNMVYQREPVTLYDSNHYLTDTIYTLNDDWNRFSRIFFIFRYADNGTYWFETAYPCVIQGETGFHLYCAYNNQVHDAYGYFDTSNSRQMVIQGSLSGSYPYLMGVYGLYNY